MGGAVGWRWRWRRRETRTHTPTHTNTHMKAPQTKQKKEENRGELCKGTSVSTWDMRITNNQIHDTCLHGEAVAFVCVCV